jgi:hypothetical protein
VCIGTASIIRSMTATAEAIFWQAIEASAIRARTTSLDLRSKGRPGNVALARIKTGVPSQFLVTMPRDGAIIFSDLIGKLDVLYVHCPKCSRAGRYRVQHLVEERGRNAKLIDSLDEISARLSEEDGALGAELSLQAHQH